MGRTAITERIAMSWGMSSTIKMDAYKADQLPNLKRSREMYKLHSELLPGGVTSAARICPILGHPLYISSGSGSRIRDVDGNEYIDLWLGHGAVILGHRHPRVIEAVRNVLEMGALMSTETELNGRLAKKIVDMVPSIEMVRFTGSGTETTMHCIRLARGYTKKNKIIRFEGHYHGCHDSVLMGYHPPLEKAGPEEAPTPPLESAGIPGAIPEYTITLPFNNAELLEKTVRRHKEDLAAIICEPINYNCGCITAKQGYLETMRELTEENGILLIFDEIVSGFRPCAGGAQKYLGITPDLTTLGKVLGGTFPISAFGGKKEIMQHLMPVGDVFQSGTYNGQQACVAASLACLEELEKPETYPYLWDVSGRYYKGLSEIFEDLNIKARLQSVGPMFGIHFGTTEEVTNYREAARCDKEAAYGFYRGMMKRGVIFWPTFPTHQHKFSLAHTKEDVDQILEASESTLKEMKSRS